MANSEIVKTSKFLSKILRHDPGLISLELDDQGWIEIETLLRQCAVHSRVISREFLLRVVAESDKQRFAVSEDGLRIRANQGHSIVVDLSLPRATPPELLFHGTAKRFLDSIRATGLNSGNRQHVHLSLDEATAWKVGQRHGPPVILTIKAGSMHAAGHAFYLSANGVWLTESVAREYLLFPPE